MAQPITWRNVGTQAFSAGANMLQQANNSLQTSLDGLGSLAAAGNRRADQQTDERSVNFMNEMRSRFTTPEALQQAQQSGALDQLRGQFGQVNAQARDPRMIDNLVTSMQGKQVAQAAHDQFKLEQFSKPFEDQLRSLQTSGDFDGMAEILGSNELNREGFWNQEITRGRRGKVLEDERVQDRNAMLSDRAYNLDQRKKREAEEARIDRLKKIQGSQFQTQFDARNTAQNQTREILDRMSEDLGPGVMQDMGNPDVYNSWSKEKQEAVDRYRGELSGAQYVPTNDDLLKAGMSALQVGGASPFEAAQLMGEVENQMIQNSKGSAITRAEMQADFDRLDNRPEYRDNSLVREIKEGVSQVDRNNRILSEVDSELEDQLGRYDTKSIHTFLNEAIGKGFNFAGEKYVLPAAMVSHAIRQMDNSSMGPLQWDRTLKSTLTDMMKSGAWLDQLKKGKQYEQERKATENKYSKKADPYDTFKQDLLSVNPNQGKNAIKQRNYQNIAEQENATGGAPDIQDMLENRLHEIKKSNPDDRLYGLEASRPTRPFMLPKRTDVPLLDELIEKINASKATRGIAPNNINAYPDSLGEMRKKAWGF